MLNTKSFLSIILFSLIALMLPTHFATASTPLDAIAAYVNNGVITESQVAHKQALYQRQLIAQNEVVPPAKVLRAEILKQMIQTELQLQLAESSGINITSSQVTEAIKSIAQSNGASITQLRESIENNGLSYKEYRDNIRKQLLITQLQRQAIASKITVSDLEVDQFLKAHPSDDDTNSEYHLKHILVRLNDKPTHQAIVQAKTLAKQLLQQLESGTTFDQIALLNGSDHGSIDSGDLGWRKIPELPSLFANHVKSMKNNSIKGPIQAPNGFHLIKLEGVRHHRFHHRSKQLHLRQIMLQEDPMNNASQLKQRLLNIKQRIENGKSFSELANEYSKDKMTNAKGGDMGWLSIDHLPPVILTATKPLKKREISRPVQFENRWYLIQKLGEREIDDTKTFKREQVRQLLFRRKLEAEEQSWLEQLRNSAFVKIVS